MAQKRITEVIGLLRLSKPKKGMTKLQTAVEAYGIEHQRSEIERIAAQQGATVIAWFTDIESGTRKGLDKRPEMLKAISMTKVRRAVLVIGKLDRLARNVHFISGLMESGVDFICCDNPTANKLTIHVLAAVGEAEAEAIAARTKASLTIAKKQGVLLGSAREGHWEGREHLRGTKQACAASAKNRTKKALEAYEFVWPIINTMLKEDAKLHEIAAALNAQHHVTSRGTPFHKVAVHRVIELFRREGIAA